MNFQKFSKNALWFLTSLSLLATALVSKDLLFPFITTKAFFFRVVLEMGLPFYVYLLLSSRDLRPNLKNPLNLFVLVFLLVNFISALVGVNLFRSMWGNFERMGGAYYLAHLCLLYFYVQVLGQAGGGYIKNFLKALLAVSALITLSGISGALGGPTLTLDPSLPARASATLGNPIFFASFLIFPFFLALFFVSQSKSLAAKWMYGILAFLQLIGIFQSGTRGAVVGLAIGVFLAAIVFIVLSKGKIRRYGGAGILAFAVVVVMLFTFHDKLPQGTTIRRVFNLRDSNTNSRFIQWQIALQGVKDYPVLGTGPENYYIVGNKYYDNELYKFDRSWFDKPHNYILEILTTTGVLGFAAYIGMLVAALWILWRAFKAEFLTALEACLFLAAILVYQVQNLFVFDTIPASLMFYAFLGFVSYLHFETKAVEEKGIKRQAAPSLSGGIIGTGAILAAVVAVYAAIVTNYMPARAAKNVNYGYAYAGVDPYKAAEYFETATSLPFNFDLSESSAKFSDFAAGLVRSPLAQSDPKFVDGQLSKALEYEIRAVKNAPNDPVVLQKLSNLYLYQAVFHKTGIPFEAFDAMQKAVDLAPKRVEARLGLAQLRLYQGYPEEAAKIVEEALALDPTNKSTKWQLVLVYHDAKRDEDAVKLAEQLFAEDYQPQNPGDLSWLIDYYIAKGEKDKAINLAEKSLMFGPKSVNTVAKLYEVYMKFGMQDKANILIAEFKKAQPKLWPDLEKLIQPK